jgi:uncharacterized protein YndB with AHSA1/START domain
MAPVTIRVACRLAASPERVFDAWLDSRIAALWLFATATQPLTQTAIDARVAGAFRLVDGGNDGTTEYSGEYEEIVRPRRLVFSLQAGGHLPVATRVLVDIRPRARSSYLTVIHENLPPPEAHGMECRWTGMLYGLGVTLAGGRPTEVRFRKGPIRRLAASERPLSKSGQIHRLER